MRRVAPDGAVGPSSVVTERGRDLGLYVTRPSLAPAAGGALLAYNAEAASGFDEVFLQRLDGGGAVVGAPTQLTQSEGNGLDTDWGARWPALAFEPSIGEYLVVWEAREANILRPFAVKAQRLDGVGSPQGGPMVVSAAPTMLDHSRGPLLVPDPASQAWLVVRYERGDTGTDSALHRLLGRRLPFVAPATGAAEVRIDDPAFGPGAPGLAPGGLVVSRPYAGAAGAARAAARRRP